MQHPAHIPLEKAMGIGQDPEISDLPGPSGCLNFVWALSGVIGPVKKKEEKKSQNENPFHFQFFSGDQRTPNRSQESSVGKCFCSAALSITTEAV